MAGAVFVAFASGLLKESGVTGFTGSGSGVNAQEVILVRDAFLESIATVRWKVVVMFVVG